MSRNGSGTYNLPAGNPVVTGTTISSTWANNTLSDIATALTGSLAADGQTTATGPLNMGTQKINNLGTGTAPTDAAVVSQVTTAVAITGGTIDGTPIGATTASTGKFTTLQLSSYATIKALLETATITAAAPSATQTFDALTQAVEYYTTNAANNWTLNVRGDSGTTLNSIMSTGQSLSITVLTTQGGTAYYNSAVQIDGTGTGVTTKWQGGTAPSSGNTSSIDIYSYVVIKTGSATFTVLASQTKFA